MKEQAYQRAILDYLALRRIYAWKNSSTGIFNKKTGGWIPIGLTGVSDILGILPDGRFLAIEVKSPTGKLTQNQIDFLDIINKNGGVAFMAVTIDDVKEHLRLAGCG